MFTDAELEYINTLQFARIATSTPDGHPHVVPGRALIEGGKVVIPGWEMKRSYKFRQARKNPWIAVVWDTREPEGNKGVEVRGECVAIEDPNNPDDSYQYRIEMTPTKVFSWGVNEHYNLSFQQKMGYPPHPFRSAGQPEPANARESI